MPESEDRPLRFCIRHTGRAATYACEGCGSGLCDDCVEEGHRLFLCPRCGERALPLERRPAVAGPRVRMQQGHEQRVPLLESLAYPFRGLGGLGFWGFLALWLVVIAIGSIRGLGCGALFLRIVLFSLVPGLVLKIIATTYDGETELPEWPDVSDFAARIGETLLALFVLLIGMTPAGLLLRFARCTPDEAVSGEWGLACHLLLFVGLFVGVSWWTAALGAMALFSSNWYALRFGLHAKLLARTWPDCFGTALAISTLLVASNLLHGLFAAIPFAGTVLGSALTVYTVMVAPHWIGLLFRRHLPAVENLYVVDEARHGDSE